LVNFRLNKYNNQLKEIIRSALPMQKQSVNLHKSKCIILLKIKKKLKIGRLWP